MAKTRLKVEERDDQCWNQFPWPRAESRRVDRGGHRMEDGRMDLKGVSSCTAPPGSVSEVQLLLSTQKISMATVCSIYEPHGGLRTQMTDQPSPILILTFILSLEVCLLFVTKKI